MSIQVKLYIVVDTSFGDVGFHCAQAVHAAMAATKKWNLDANMTVVILASQDLLQDTVFWSACGMSNAMLDWREPDYDNWLTAVALKPGHTFKGISNLPLLSGEVK